MAPEKFSDSSLVSPQTAVFALGLLVFYALTGQRFWLCLQNGGSLTTLMNEALVLPMPTAIGRAAELGVAAFLPPAVAAWCDQCLQRDARARFTDAESAWNALAITLPLVPGALLELDPSCAMVYHAAVTLDPAPQQRSQRRASTLAVHSGLTP